MASPNPQKRDRTLGLIVFTFFLILLIVTIVLPIKYSATSIPATAISGIISLLGVFLSFLQAFPKARAALIQTFSITRFPTLNRNQWLFGLLIIILVATNVFQFIIILGSHQPGSAKTTPTPANTLTATTSITSITSTVLVGGNTQSATVTSTNSTASQFAYDFEDGTIQGWDTSEGQYKLATLQVVSDPIQPGNHVLEVMTKLTGDTNPNNEVYRHTDAKVYFTQRIPIGFNNPPPYNFQGKQVSCQVYLPEGLTSGSPPPTVNISVKDISQRNDNGKPITIDTSITGKWMTLSFVVGKYQGDADQGFDGTQVISIGVQIIVPPGSTLNYTGPFFIDNCLLPHN